MPQLTTLHCADQHPLLVHEFKGEAAQAVLVIASAFGIKESFYHKFASYMSEQGFHCITFDFRGTGNNHYRANYKDLDLSDWGQQDLEAVLQYAGELKLPVHFLGHSIGAQILGLAPSCLKVSKTVFVAASAPYWKRWPAFQNYKILFTTQVALPLAARVLNPFPAKTFGLGNQNLPSAAVLQWAKWMSKPDYIFDPSFKLSCSRYQDISCPLLAFGFSDDKLAPKANIDKFVSHLKSAQVTLDYIDPDSLGAEHIGHTGFFREHFKDSLWLNVRDWLSASKS